MGVSAMPRKKEKPPRPSTLYTLRISPFISSLYAISIRMFKACADKIGAVRYYFLYIFKSAGFGGAEYDDPDRMVDRKFEQHEQIASRDVSKPRLCSHQLHNLSFQRIRRVQP